MRIATNEKLTSYTVLLSSLAFGTALATKPQTAYFVLVFIVYILLKSKGDLRRRFLNAGIFLLGTSVIVGFWYFRAYILTGNPFYPAFAQSFGGLTNVLPVGGTLAIVLRERLKSMVELSPVAILVVLILAPSILYKVVSHIYEFSFALVRQVVRKRLDIPADLGLFIMFVIIEFIGLPSFFSESRYLLFGYLPILIILAPRLKLMYESSYAVRGIFIGIITIMIGYYLLRTALFLPYGLGWANQNHYLTRILSRDNSSYYDFNELFSREINTTDLVGIYGINGLYYANFQYRDVAYIISDNNRSLLAFKKAGITKLLLKNVTIKGFCKQERLIDCNRIKIRLVANYEPAQQYLYTLR